MQFHMVCSIMDLNITFFSNSFQAGHGIDAMENSTNASSQATNGPEVEQSYEFRIIKIVCYCIILLGSSLGNSLVIYIIASNARMRTPSNILILNLAVCDFMTPVLSIPFDFVLEEYNYVWMYGAVTCKILWPFTTMTSASAALTLAAISLDRYRTIMHPFKSRLTMVQNQIHHCGHLYVFFTNGYTVFLYADSRRP